MTASEAFIPDRTVASIINLMQLEPESIERELGAAIAQLEEAAEFCQDHSAAIEDATRILEIVRSTPKAMAALPGARSTKESLVRKLRAIDRLATRERHGKGTSGAANLEVAAAWGNAESSIASDLTTYRAAAESRLEQMIGDCNADRRRERLQIVSENLRFYGRLLKQGMKV